MEETANDSFFMEPMVKISAILTHRGLTEAFVEHTVSLYGLKIALCELMKGSSFLLPFNIVDRST